MRNILQRDIIHDHASTTASPVALNRASRINHLCYHQLPWGFVIGSLHRMPDALLQPTWSVRRPRSQNCLIQTRHTNHTHRHIIYQTIRRQSYPELKWTHLALLQLKQPSNLFRIVLWRRHTGSGTQMYVDRHRYTWVRYIRTYVERAGSVGRAAV